MVVERLSEHSVVDLADPSAIDIGASNANTAYRSQQNFSRQMAYIELGTFNSSDDLNEAQLQQASSTGGANVKDLTTFGATGNYDTDNPVDADGDFVIIETRSEDLDVDASTPFFVVRGRVVVTGNNGTDDVHLKLTSYGSSYARKELQGDAVTGQKIYVDTNT